MSIDRQMVHEDEQDEEEVHHLVDSICVMNNIQLMEDTIVSTHVQYISLNIDYSTNSIQFFFSSKNISVKQDFTLCPMDIQSMGIRSYSSTINCRSDRFLKKRIFSMKSIEILHNETNFNCSIICSIN